MSLGAGGSSPTSRGNEGRAAHAGPWTGPRRTLAGLHMQCEQSTSRVWPRPWRLRPPFLLFLGILPVTCAKRGSGWGSVDEKGGPEGERFFPRESAATGRPERAQYARVGKLYSNTAGWRLTLEQRMQKRCAGGRERRHFRPRARLGERRTQVEALPHLSFRACVLNGRHPPSQPRSCPPWPRSRHPRGRWP